MNILDTGHGEIHVRRAPSPGTSERLSIGKASPECRRLYIPKVLMSQITKPVT
jgi:hypothetical protein